MRNRLLVVIAVAVFVVPAIHPQSGVFDVVIRNGRVIDPESRLDAVRTIGIRGGKIAAIGVGALQGKQVIDAKGLVVAPATVTDKSTYQQPALPSVGFLHVLVNGAPVVVSGVLMEGTHPGQGARAPIH